MSKNTKDTTVDIDYADQAVPKEGRKGFLTMFMIMLGFTFFSASMWVGQQMAAGLDFWGFIKSLLLGGAILGVYTGLLGYVGAKTGLSMDLLAKRAFGEKGSYLSSAMISFTQIGWFGVGVAMFAIPVSGELLGGSKAAMWALVLVAGGCMTASAYFGIDSLTVVSYIAVPLVAILGTVARKLSHLPVVVDPSHAGGKWWLVDPMAKASVAAGADGLIIEVHNSPETALCDGAQSLKPEKYDTLLKEITGIAKAVGKEM